jgi:hypothetical protein
MATMATRFRISTDILKQIPKIIKLSKKPLPPLPHCHDE